METKINYTDIGVRIGLEIHQELSGNKLFCSCISNLQEKNKLVEIYRKIKPSMGETGDIDLASLYEQQKNQEFIYYGYKDEFCLVETDDEPPHEVNEEALKAALQLASFFRLQIPDELQVMRKIITNGSVTSGFQRSILTGYGTEESYIETVQGRVKIKDLYLEEESAKIIKKEENKTYYSLSRLGIPLIEIGTLPDIKTPEQAKEAAQQIGMILRSIALTRRGLGTIRQDLNISIKGHPRVELKGFQDLRSMPKVIDNEIYRQLENLKSKKELKSEVRKVEPDFSSSYLRPMPTSARLYPETDIVPIKITKELLSEIKIPELITERAVNIEKKYNISPVLAREILKLNIPFDYYAEKYSINPNLIAEILIEIPKELKTRFNVDPKKISGKDFEFVFEHLESKTINREAVKDILLDIAQGKHIDLNKYKQVDNKEIENKLKEIISKHKGASFSALMGEAMKEFRGSVSGQEVMKALKKLLEQK